MNLFQAIILGIVQGFTEFLPVSSSGHLQLFQSLFHISQPTQTFDIVLHVGTLVPIFIVFRKEVWSIIRKPFQKLTGLLILATIPAIVVALLFGDFIDSISASATFLWIGFIITGLFLIYADNAKEGKKNMEQITAADALIIGCMQALAIAPSISRSGGTITGALGRKLTRETAAKFSFLMSIPAIAGALVLAVKDVVTGDVPAEALPVLPTVFGFIAAMLCGYLAIRFMLKVIQSAKLRYFSYYVFVLAALIIVDEYVTHKFF